MIRNLNVIIKFGKHNINIKTIEYDGLSNIVISQDQDKLTNRISAINFIQTSINKINSDIGGKINSAIVLVENNSQLNAKLQTITKDMQLINGVVNRKDFDNSMKLIYKDFENNIDEALIHVQPVQYIVHGIEKKRYSTLPFGKKGTKLTINAVITTISKKVFSNIHEIMRSSGLKVDYIATSAQVIPHEVMSRNVFKAGGASIHIDNRATYVTLNYNNSTMRLKLINRGYSDILANIKNKFNCSYERANILFNAYGNLDPSAIKIDKAIINAHNGISSHAYRISDLNAIIKKELELIFMEAKSYIDNWKTNNMSITISGVCNILGSLDKFAKLMLNSINVIVYKPISYICKENMNIEYVGVLKYINTYNKNIEQDFESIVHTSPNTMSLFAHTHKVGFFKRLMTKLKQRGNYAQWQ